MLNFECAFLRLYHKDAVWQLGEVDVDGARVVGLQAFYYFAIQGYYQHFRTGCQPAEFRAETAGEANLVDSGVAL